MKLHSLFCTATLAACLAAPAAAMPVVGTVTAKDTFNGYMGVMTNIQVLSGSASLPDTAFIFCIDRFAYFPKAGSSHQYTLSDSFEQVMANPGAIDKATGLLHYVIDTYYEPFMTGSFGTSSGYGFNQVMWELTSDFNGARNSLNTSTGSINDRNAKYAIYTTIVRDLKQNFASISSDYRSEQYDIHFLHDVDTDYQSLAMVTDKALNEVPEPTSLALMLAGGFGFAVRATRRKPAV